MKIIGPLTPLRKRMLATSYNVFRKWQNKTQGSSFPQGAIKSEEMNEVGKLVFEKASRNQVSVGT